MSIRDQIAAKRAEAQKVSERTSGRLGQSTSSSRGGRAGASTISAQEGLEERTVIGQIRKAHKSGKLDISSFSLNAIPPDVYTRLLGIPLSDLSKPLDPTPVPERKPNDPSKVRPSAEPGNTREQVFGLPTREVDWGEATELIAFKAGDNALNELEREIGAFGGLKSIDLGKNQLSLLPSTFADLLRLTSIDISSNHLTSVPSSVLLLPALQSLDLSHNLIASTDFSSPIAPSEEGLRYGAGFLTTSFGRVSLDSRPIWPALVSLDLSYNELRTEHLTALRDVEFGALTKLNLAGNQLTGELQALDLGLDARNAPSLTTLVLNHNKGLVSFDGARSGCTIEMEGCNFVTNSTASSAAATSAGPSSIPRTKGLAVPQPDLTLVYKTHPAATFDSEPLALDFDLYLPPVPAGPSGHPLVVWFHGGGLLQGNKENLPPHFRRLPSHAYGSEHVAVISPNYRLAPQVPILDILSDIDALMMYVRTKLNARIQQTHSSHDIDVNRMCLSGGSAGGYLALIAGLPIPKSIRDPQVGGYRGDTGAGVKCLAPFYPITDLDDPFWAEKTDPVPWFGRHVADEEARPHLDLKSPPIGTSVSGGPRSILYMYMLQHGLFPSLLFLKQRSISSGGESFRPEPETLSLTRRLDLISRSRDKPDYPPIYFVYGTADRAVQPQDKAIEALRKVADIEVEKLEGVDHGYDEDPEVECERFREWLGSHLVR